jgi:uncharacterized membrane protein YidH (DUF202 family)
MNFRILLAFAVLLPLMAGEAHGSGVAVGAQLHSFLSQYVPNSTIDSSSYYNASIGQDSYVIIQQGTYSYAVVNTTKGYSFVLNNQTAFLVLRPFLLSQFYPSNSEINYLNNTLHAFETEANPPLADCLTETGLVQYTCTNANSCFSCSAVPVCRKAMAQTGGPSGTLGLGIMNFSYYYGILNGSYRSYYSTLSSMNQSNIATSLARLSGIVSDISSVSSTMPNNPIFPLPASFPPSELSSCNSYSATSAPWYCQSLGFCEATTFNATALSSLQSSIAALQAMPLSNSSIYSIAANATEAARQYMQPLIIKQFNGVINSTYGRYNSTIRNATSLLSKFSNQSLANSISALEADFSMLKAYNTSRNASYYNQSIEALLSNVSVLYSSVHSSYAALQSLAANNTAAILSSELNYKNVPQGLSSIASEQQSINAQLASGINSSQYQSMYANLVSIKQRFSALGPISLASAVKGIDGYPITQLLSGSGATVQQKISTTPAYAFLISLLIAIVIILVVYMGTFHRLKRKRKLRLHPRARRAWILLFVAMAAIGVAYALVTYSFAQSANAFLPMSGFLNSVSSHSTVYIAFNGVAVNSSIVNCSDSLRQTLVGEGKVVHVITISNYSCVSAGSSASGAGCFNSILASGDPVIVMGGSGSGISYKGMYGYTLYASGYPASGSYCVLNDIFKVQ